MNKLAICVPTLNNPEVVSEILEYCVDFLSKYNVDIYYYDSSDNSDTKDVIEKIKKDHRCNNIFHVIMPLGALFGEKMDYIFSGYGLCRDYAYIWPIKNRCICNELLLSLVLELCDGITDLIIPIDCDCSVENNFLKIQSKEELYEKYAAPITSIGTVIYNTETFFSNYQYGKSVDANNSLLDFWHYSYVFNELCNLDDAEIYIVNNKNAHILTSFLGQSLYMNRFFEIWIDEWIYINNELPDIYAPYRSKVIKDTTSIEELLGNRSRMMDLYEKGILTNEIYEKYRDKWQYVSYVPEEIICSISNGRYDLYHDVSLYDGDSDIEKILLKAINLIDKNVEFSTFFTDNLKNLIMRRIVNMERYNNIKVLVYGTVQDIFNEIYNVESNDERLKLFQMLLVLMR